MDKGRLDLHRFLGGHAETELSRIIETMANSAAIISQRIRQGALGGEMHAAVGVNTDGDTQKLLDIFADEAFERALGGCSVAALASEERDAVTAMKPDGAYLVALDPLDGSSNIEVNMTIGTVFSVLLAPVGVPLVRAFLQPGHKQCAAGIVLYGPQTQMIFTTGAGTHVATLDPISGEFIITQPHLTIPEGKHEFAINMSNSRHWPDPVKAYVDDILMGAEGPRRHDFNMRWVASMVADVYRVLVRGGIYLYPDDARPGYAKGRLHLLYEANPVAFLIEQAGGLAIDGVNRILDLDLTDLHQRTPLIFGATDKVEVARSYFLDGHRSAARAPLFGRRGLWRVS